MKRNRFASTLAVITAFAALTLGLSGCEPSVTISYTSRDPGKTLQHSWSPGIPIETGVVNSCYRASSDVAGRANVCRVVDGYDQAGDDRNWKITLGGGYRVLAQYGENSSTYGRVIVLDGGQVFEGCNYYSADTTYNCDYRIRKQIVLKTSGSAYSYVLRKLWNWTKYVGSAAGCAGGIAGVWTGQRITLPMLSSCADGPL